jgi:hypothetical protein
VHRKPNCHQLLLHGQPIQLEIHSSAFDEAVIHLTSPFVSDDTIERGGLLRGCIGPFDYGDVARHISPQAKLIARPDEMSHLYALDERCWLVDERWGLCEINLLKRRWQSWIVPNPSIDAAAGAEAAIWWPMAMLLRGHRLELIPALSVGRDDWGALILSPYSLDSELVSLPNCGFEIIGRRWSSLCNAGERIRMGHLPAADATRAQPWEAVRKTACRAVFIIEPGCRPLAKIRAPMDARDALRRAWPMIDLPAGRRRAADMIARLARQCRCLSVQLSPRRGDLAWALSNACEHASQTASTAG